jgi:hypothetical protein
MAAQRLGLRGQLWPQVTESQIWNRKKEAGFVTIPRTLPLIMQIQDALTKNTPISSTYLDLWCRVYDEGFVKLDKPHEMALASGFTTPRGPGIWATRLDLLQQHGFIVLAPGAQGSRSFALIYNPYLVIHSKREEINPRLFNALMAQAMAIGAQPDPAAFLPTPPPPPPSLMSPPPPPPVAGSPFISQISGTPAK